ncbi:MAG: Hcp1 family type VI secretion system effector [Desulfobacteraceae bacterium 4572_88]|nr:MAG: Hcp1 family type VI secretion system effector [Desulfobacteraceae bacterium 4572_88]
MPTPAYMSIEGEEQGNITEGCNTEDSVGNVYQEDHGDEFIVQAFEHVLTVPTDVQSGQPAGPRRHEELIVTKIFDKCSPLLYNALVTGERLPTSEIRWYRTDMTGKQEHYFTHEIEDSVITKIETFMPNAQDPTMEHFTHLERIHFRYRKITWTHEVAGTEGTDDWRAPVEA